MAIQFGNLLAAWTLYRHLSWAKFVLRVFPSNASYLHHWSVRNSNLEWSAWMVSVFDGQTSACSSRNYLRARSDSSLISGAQEMPADAPLGRLARPVDWRTPRADRNTRRVIYRRTSSKLKREKERELNEWLQWIQWIDSMDSTNWTQWIQWIRIGMHSLERRAIFDKWSVSNCGVWNLNLRWIFWKRFLLESL